MKFGNNVDLQQNQLLNAVFQNLASAPSSPKFGQIYFNTTTNTSYQWNGTTWQPWDVTQLVGVIPIAALAVNPLARANQTGTQLASTISNLASTVQAYTLDTFAAPLNNVPFNTQRITGLADPVNPQDAATKNYVDTNIQATAAGIQGKPVVVAVSTANISSLSGLPTVDGVTLSANQRLLLVGQSTASQNGPWIVGTGSWTRPTGDPSPNNELTLGAVWYVEQGTANAGTQWILSTPTSGAITPGTTNVTINQFNGSSNLTFSNGVAKTGSVVSAAVVAGGGILAGSGGLSLDTTQAARFSKQSFTGNGSSTTFTLTHALNTQQLTMQLQDSAYNAVVCDWQAISSTQVTFTFGQPPASGSVYYVTMIG